MPAKDPKSIALQKSTAFWKSLGIEVPRRSHALKKYKPKTETSALKRLGVNAVAIDFVYNRALAFSDQLFFKNFCRFFKRDIPTVKTWTKTKTASAAFLKLFEIYDKGGIDVARDKYFELALIFEYYRKGEGQKFAGKLLGKISLDKFSTTNIRRRLTFSGSGSEYKERGSAILGTERIFWLQRNADGQKTNKFIKLYKNGKKLQVSLSFDSKKEYYIVKSELEKVFKTYLETPQVSCSLEKLISFFKKGKSNFFQLTGCSYLSDQFRVFISTQNNRLENVSEFEAFKQHIRQTKKKVEALNQIRLAYLSGEMKPLSISILTYREGVFGAILLKPEDKGLTASQRRKFYADFEQDFGLPLNSFIDYDDLTNEAIYKHFLQVTTGKPLNVEARSSQALSIYSRLSSLNLILSSSVVEETSRVCVNKLCRNKFYPIWDNRKYCSSCGDLLITGKHIEIRSIDEKSVATYLKDNYKASKTSAAEKKLLKRALYVAQITIGNRSADFIPIAKNLSDRQLEILQHRYPNGVIVTAANNKELLREKGFEAVSLWEIVYSMEEKKNDKINDVINDVEDGNLAKIRKLANEARSRIADNTFYEERNEEVKNFGAELFEADCSTLFDYVFGNSLWLGAKHRGSSLPDGYTAFPILQSKNGCFIWDTKFSWIFRSK